MPIFSGNTFTDTHRRNVLPVYQASVNLSISQINHHTPFGLWVTLWGLKQREWAFLIISNFKINCICIQYCIFLSYMIQRRCHNLFSLGTGVIFILLKLLLHHSKVSFKIFLDQYLKMDPDSLDKEVQFSNLCCQSGFHSCDKILKEGAEAIAQW